jgi:hypothetical protein
MKVKKSRLLFAGALFFLAFGWHILDSQMKAADLL